LVTGGAGFIGSHVVDLLLAGGYRVVALDSLVRGTLDNLPSGCGFVRCDITDGAATEEAVARFHPEVIVHLAAHTTVEESLTDPCLDASVNVMGTLSVLRAAARNHCRKVVFASSSTVYGEPQRQPVQESDVLNPISPYGASKTAAEHYVRILCDVRGISHVVLRFGNVFGPRDSPSSRHVVTSFISTLLAGETPVIEWDGEQAKDYVHVHDVARAVAAAIELGHNDSFNIGSEEAVSVNRLYELVCSLLALQVTPLRRERRPGDVRTFVMNCAKAHHTLKWRPLTALSEGLRTTIDAMAVDQLTTGSTIDQRNAGRVDAPCVRRPDQAHGKPVGTR
jgi:UDP-glucose 4-epimerase